MAKWLNTDGLDTLFDEGVFSTDDEAIIIFASFDHALIELN